MNELLFFVGSYSVPGDYFPDAKGEGVTACLLDPATGGIRRWSACPQAVNATYLDITPDGKILLVASDLYLAAGEVMSFAIEPRGKLRWLSTQSTHGTATCHVCCEPNGRRAFVAGYMNGKLSVHTLDHGKLGAADPLITYQGHGPNPARQEGAHTHQAIVSPDGRWLYVCDLGSDQIWRHDLRLSGTAFRAAQGTKTPAGYGPRHLVCHPVWPRVYVLCELNGHVLVYESHGPTGKLNFLDDIPSLPKDFTGRPSAAAIKLHPSHRAIYVSNRQHDSLTAFAVSDRDGGLTFHGQFASGGIEPREFAIDPTGQWLVAANQKSHNLVSFPLDPATGLPSGGQPVVFSTIDTPVTVQFAPLERKSP